jgi:hypothetical protein
MAGRRLLDCTSRVLVAWLRKGGGEGIEPAIAYTARVPEGRAGGSDLRYYSCLLGEGERVAVFS